MEDNRLVFENDENEAYDEADYLIFDDEEIEDLPLTESQLMSMAHKYGKMRYRHLKENNPSLCYNLCALGVMKHEMEIADERGNEIWEAEYWKKRKHMEEHNEENLNAITISAMADSYANEVIYQTLITQEGLLYHDEIVEKLVFPKRKV